MPGLKQKSIGHFILLLMLIRSLVLPLTYLEYQLRKDYITAYLCENRFTPEMLCDGQCYLAKKLAERQSQTPDAASVTFNTLLNTPLNCENCESFTFTPYFPETKNPFFFQPPSKSRDFPSGIFRPPAGV